MLAANKVDDLCIGLSSNNLVANQSLAVSSFETVFKGSNNAAVARCSEVSLLCELVVVCHDPLGSFLDIAGCDKNFCVANGEVETADDCADLGIELIVLDIFIPDWVLWVRPLSILHGASNCLQAIRSDFLAHFFGPNISHLLASRKFLDDILGGNGTRGVHLVFFSVFVAEDSLLHFFNHGDARFCGIIRNKEDLLANGLEPLYVPECLPDHLLVAVPQDAVTIEQEDLVLLG